MSEPPKDPNFKYLSYDEFERAKNIWPCRKCGRFEHETCNGMGAVNSCPNGRSRQTMNELLVSMGREPRPVILPNLNFTPTMFASETEGAKQRQL